MIPIELYEMEIKSKRIGIVMEGESLPDAMARVGIKPNPKGDIALIWVEDAGQLVGSKNGKVKGYLLSDYEGHNALAELMDEFHYIIKNK